jgi:hypothetical protein
VINLFPETLKQTTTRSQTNLINAPGKRSFATRSGTGRPSAIYEQDGRCFTVAGPFFDEIKSDGTTTAIWGTSSPGGTRPRVDGRQRRPRESDPDQRRGRARCSTPARTLSRRSRMRASRRM